jgi:transcriptional regulator with XRE-family HTH domain
MGRRRVSLSDQIRRAVDASGLSRYRIAKELGIAESTMSRFMAGKGGLSLANLDALADLLNLNIAAEPGRPPAAERSGKKG